MAKNTRTSRYGAGTRLLAIVLSIMMLSSILFLIVMAIRMG